jgi:hypothetical protein
MMMVEASLQREWENWSRDCLQMEHTGDASWKPFELGIKGWVGI